MLLICYGTRPEFIKVKPIINILSNNNIKHKTLFTGQHKDIIDNFITDYELEIPNLDNRLNSVVSSGLSFKFPKDITHILIQGDTSSVLSMAISAFNNKIKIIHLESGLRTYDFENPYPEEVNRQLISRISDINFCPTKLNKENLISERVNGDNYVVGNTVLDNLTKFKNKCEYSNKVLITLHRRENHGIIKDYFKVISELANHHKDLEFILPIHPNPNVIKYKSLLKEVKVVNSLNHEDLINILIKCKFVITDSGGLQEECSFFNKKAIVCRKITERPESIGEHSFMCESPKKLYELVDTINNNFVVNKKCPYGEGDSSNKIYKILNSLKII